MGAWGDGVITFRDFGDGGSVLIKWNHEDFGALQRLIASRIRFQR